MAELSELSYCSSGLAFKSELLRRPEAHHGFAPKLSHHGGKTEKTERISQTCSYTALHFIGKRQRFFSVSEVFLFCSG